MKMARPKEKIPPVKNKTLIDRCRHEKDHLKEIVIKQLQKDLEGLLTDETHSDLVIRAEGIDIKVHRFIIRTRSQVIYDLLLELSTSNDPDVLVMPAWIPHKTVLFIVRKLYFVETDPLDEAVDKQDDLLMDYLKSLLTKQIENEGSKECKQDGKTNQNENDQNQLNKNDGMVNGDKQARSTDVKSITNGNDVEKKDRNERNIITKEEDRDSNSPDTNGEAETNDDTQCSFSDMIKLSYGLSVPYEACNRVGEDLLRGYLQEIEPDCVITVSDVHFKAHKSILCARSSYFSMMLGGSWKENSDIHLEGVTPNVIEQLLLYLYGGVVDIISCTLDELMMCADMYGMQGLSDVIISYLKREYCHMFHKICTGCEEHVPEALSVAITFRFDDFRDKCSDWINRNLLKMWRSKHLAKQPQEVLDCCYQKAVSDLNEESAIDLLLSCENLNHNIPRISWTEPLLCHIIKVQDTVIEYISCNFVKIIKSSAFNNLDKGLGYKISLLEEIFAQVIKSLPINKACEAYNVLSFKKADVTNVDPSAPEKSEDFVKFVNFLLEKCEKFLKLHVHQIIRTEGWGTLSHDTKDKLMEGGCFIMLKDTPDKKKAAKAQREARQNYIPPNPRRRTNNKTETKPSKGTSSDKGRNSSDQKTQPITGSDTNRDMDTSSLHGNNNSNDPEYLGAVGGIVSPDRHVLTPTDINSAGSVLFSIESLDPVVFYCELVPILHFTFQKPQDYDV